MMDADRAPGPEPEPEPPEQTISEADIAPAWMEETGGRGNFFTRPDKVRSDLALVRRALRCGWNIPEALRAELIETCAAIMRDPSQNGRARAQAANVIRGCQSQNIALERLAFEEQRAERLPRGGPRAVTVNQIGGQVQIGTPEDRERRIAAEVTASLEAARLARQAWRQKAFGPQSPTLRHGASEPEK
jgi:hypothetical protein